MILQRNKRLIIAVIGILLFVLCGCGSAQNSTDNGGDGTEAVKAHL